MIKSNRENFSHSGIVSYQKHSILKNKEVILNNKFKKLSKDKTEQIFFDNMQNRINNINNLNNNNNKKYKITKYIPYIKNTIGIHSFKNYLPRTNIFILPYNKTRTYNVQYNQINKETQNIIIKKEILKNVKDYDINDKLGENRSTLNENKLVNYEKMFGRINKNILYQSNILLKNKLLSNSIINLENKFNTKNINSKSINVFKFKNYSGRNKKHKKKKINKDPIYIPKYNLVEKKITKNIKLKYDNIRRFQSLNYNNLSKINLNTYKNHNIK